MVHLRTALSIETFGPLSRHYIYVIVSVLQSKLSMDARIYSALILLLMVVSFSVNIEGTKYESSAFNRSSFPEDFVFGTASASYQYEGAYKKDGRGPSNWDIYTHKHPERIADRGNGDIANDHYHRYKEDVQLMKDMGMDAYRFSISWSRVLPNGKISGGVNQKGIQFYNNLIDEVLSKGLKPFVTIFHWDVPQYLEDEYGGFLSSSIVPDFQDYAELLFKEFGDRVKHWITLNEPWSFSRGGYNTGNYAPGRCSIFVGNCSAGNSATEPYIVSHNQLLAHAAAVKVYKEKYQVKQEGKIGITLVLHWMVPWDHAHDQKEAAQRAIDFMFGWFIDPLTYGDYPETMKKFVKDRLPKFTKEQSYMLIGSYDFLGLNYYTAYFTKHIPLHDNAEPSYQADCHCDRTSVKNGVPIGKKSASDWLYVYPQGILDVLLYTKKNYKNPIIYITENGVSEANNVTLPLEEQLKDTQRIDYHYNHLMLIRKAINKGVILKGYFAWSLLDNFEWEAGYSVRFGINYVDYQTLKRYPKHSSVWFKKFLLH